MKKILLGIACLALMASCAGNSSTEKSSGDSLQPADSTVQVDTSKSSVEQATQDSASQGSTAKAEEQPKGNPEYDKLVDDYLSATTKLDGLAKKVKNGKNVNYDTVNSVITKCGKLEKQIKKVKGQLSPEQLEKFKKGQKKWAYSIGWFVA